MEPLPYYKWLWRDYRSSRRVLKMDYIAKGFYRELLDEQWERGFIPSDMKLLADICECPLKVMEKAWPQLAPCFPESEDGMLVNPKMEAQRTEKDAHRVKQANAGRSGAFAKASLANASKSQKDSGKSHIAEQSKEEKKQSKEEEKTLASTADAVPAERGKVLGTLPLNDGSEYQVFENDVGELQRLYPAVDVRQAFRSMKGWMISHPNRRKTKKGIKSFITSWLSREQDSSRHQGAGNGNRNSKTGGNLDAAAITIAAFEQEERNREASDEVLHTEAGGCDPGDPGSLRGGLIDLRAG